MKKYWYILLLVAAVFVSCHKKDFPENIPGPPGEFFFNGDVAGNKVMLRAGTNDYYMYSSHVMDNNGYYIFVAELQQKDCKDCKNSLKISISDFKYSFLNEAVKIDSSLMPGPYPLYGIPFYEVHFKSLFNQPAATYSWDFGDNSTSRAADPVHIYNSAGDYSVSLYVNSLYGCQQYISNREKIEDSGIRPKIMVQNISENSMDFHSSLSNTGYSYLWSFGDGGASTNSAPSHTYEVPGTYPVLLRVITDKSDTIYTRYNVATQTNPMPCLTNYSIESINKMANPSPFSNVIVNWTDEHGVVYTSNNLLQPATSYFKILSVEDFDINEKGEKTKKLRVNFSCNVYNGGLVKTITNAEAVLCVSYR